MSVTSEGRQSRTYTQLPTVSDDGRFVAFSISGRRLRTQRRDHRWGSVFVHDLHTGKTNRVSLTARGTETNSDSSGIDISTDGRYVAYGSYAATNLGGPPDAHPEAEDVYLRGPLF